MEKKVEQIINEGLAKFPEVLREKDIIALQGRLFSYCVMRLRGESHNMAVMLASQSAPKAETDRELFEGIGTLARSIIVEIPRSPNVKENHFVNSEIHFSAF